MNNQLQNLLDDALTATGNIEHSAIFRRKDVKLRANSPNFALNKQEMEQLSNLYSNSSDTRTNGITVKGVSYRTIRSDKYSIYGKCESGGVVLVRTVTLMILATYSNDMFPSVCVEAVEKLGDYFREKGK